MTITNQQKQKLWQEFERIAQFCVQEWATAVLDTLEEEIVQDSQTVYDCVADMLIGFDLQKMAMEHLRKTMEVK